MLNPHVLRFQPVSTTIFCVGNNRHFGCSRTKAPSAELWTAFLDVLVCSLKGSGSIPIFHHPGNLFLTWFPSLTTIWISSWRISSMAIINGPQRSWGTHDARSSVIVMRTWTSSAGANSSCSTGHRLLSCRASKGKIEVTQWLGRNRDPCCFHPFLFLW